MTGAMTVDKMKLQNDEFDAADGFAKELVRLFKTPVVDDDYPEVRHGYESALRNLIDALKANGRIPNVAAPQPKQVGAGDAGELLDGLSDTFKGDDLQLLSSARALIDLDKSGALVPHGIGGHARGIIEAFIIRMASPQPAPQPVEAEGREAVARKYPVAWHTDNFSTDKSATTYDRTVADRWRAKGWPVTPLYTAPQPEQPAIDPESANFKEGMAVGMSQYHELVALMKGPVCQECGAGSDAEAATMCKGSGDGCPGTEFPLALLWEKQPAIDLEQFRKPVQFWMAHAKTMMSGMSTTATHEGPRLLSLIDAQAAAPAASGGEPDPLCVQRKAACDFPRCACKDEEPQPPAGASVSERAREVLAQQFPGDAVRADWAMKSEFDGFGISQGYALRAVEQALTQQRGIIGLYIDRDERGLIREVSRRDYLGRREVIACNPEYVMREKVTPKPGAEALRELKVAVARYMKAHAGYDAARHMADDDDESFDEIMRVTAQEYEDAHNALMGMVNEDAK